jgi:hypothetical protein
VAYLSDDNHFKKIGEIIIAIFVLSWIVSALGYRLMGYHELEARGFAVIPTDAKQSAAP